MNEYLYIREKFLHDLIFHIGEIHLDIIQSFIHISSFILTGYDWIRSFRIWYQLWYMFWYTCIKFKLYHKCIYKYFKTKNHLVTTTKFLNWGGIYFLNNKSPDITSTDSNFAPENPTYDGGFIKSLWSSLIGIWKINFCVCVCLYL